MPATCLQHACNMPAHVCACLHMSAHISPHPCLHVYTMSIQISIRVSVYRSRHTYIFIRTCAHRHVVPRWSHGFVRCWRLVTTSSMPGPSAHQADRITPRRQTGLRIDMRVDMRVDVRVDVRIDMRVHVHACLRAHACTHTCTHARVFRRRRANCAGYWGSWMRSLDLGIDVCASVHVCV